MIFRKALLGFLFFVFSSQSALAEQDPPVAALPSDSCDSITGIYQVAGEYLPTQLLNGKTRKIAMEWTLFLRQSSDKKTGVQLVWNASDSVLVVKVLMNNSLPPDVSYLIKASCIGSKLTYEVDHEGYSEGGTHNKAHMKAWLDKDDAGDLIFKGQLSVASTDLLVFSRKHESEINARFFPLLKSDK